MKRLQAVLLSLAIVSLAAAVAWAGEETSWGEMKSATAMRPAGKAVATPISFQWTNVAVEGFRVVKDKGHHLILQGGTVTWDVTGGLAGTAELQNCFAAYNFTAHQAQENFRCRMEVILNGVSGVFEGRAHDHYVPGGSGTDVAQMVLQGSGGLAGLTLKAHITTAPPGLVCWEGQVLSR